MLKYYIVNFMPEYAGCNNNGLKVTEPLNILHKQVLATHAISTEAWQEMASCWHLIEVSRKEVLTRPGEVEKYLYFVLDGVQRAYIDHNGKDATLVFSYTHSFSGVVDSFFLQSPSPYFLETITKSKLLRIHYNDFVRLMEKHRELETWTRIALTVVLSGTLQRNIELLSYSAEERFTTLLKRSPQVLNMIPHKYLASYIGVDPTTFSKMLGSIRVE